VRAFDLVNEIQQTWLHNTTVDHINGNGLRPEEVLAIWCVFKTTDIELIDIALDDATICWDRDTLTPQDVDYLHHICRHHQALWDILDARMGRQEGCENFSFLESLLVPQDDPLVDIDHI
jgi:hypothetical protein